MITSAPGKVVVWGEYAVLDGAPAAVMAVERRATVTLNRSPDSRQFSATGFLTPGAHLPGSGLTDAPVTRIVNLCLAHWGLSEYPEGLSVHTDSSPFFRHGKKLGLGSSASVCVATYVALARLLGRDTSVTEVLALHRQWQGGGSGLDVAASWHGGTIRYQSGAVTPWAWPADLGYTLIWTGHSASTPESLGDFNRWRESATCDTLPALKEACDNLFAHGVTLARLHDYQKALAALDKAAALNIFTPQHARLATIANRTGLVYKPCGAGGGDIGIAFGHHPQQLTAFNEAAAREKFLPLETEIATHGVQFGN